MVAKISNINKFRARESCDSSWKIKTRCSPRAISPRGSPTTGKAASKAGGGNCPDAVITLICNIYNPGDIRTHTIRKVERSRSPLAICKECAFITPRESRHSPHAGRLCTQPRSATVSGDHTGNGGGGRAARAEAPRGTLQGACRGGRARGAAKAWGGAAGARAGGGGSARAAPIEPCRAEVGLGSARRAKAPNGTGGADGARSGATGGAESAGGTGCGWQRA